MSESIISNDKKCFICKATLDLDRHHCLHGTANRKLAEQDGLWVYLCKYHHTMSDKAVHFDKELDMTLKRTAQERWEEQFGDRKDFIKRYGKSYL